MKKTVTKKAVGPEKGATGSSRSEKSEEAQQNETTEKSETEGNEDDEKEEMASPLQVYFMNQLKGIYFVEQQLIELLPKMEEAATTEELKEAFGDHLHQTQKQLKRLDKVFKLMGTSPEAKRCQAIESLAQETEEVIAETEEGSMTRDVALIISAQKTEHYEIASYGGLVQLAITMGYDEAADLLDTTLMEEEDTDLLLTDIAESHINVDAEHEEENSSIGSMEV